MLKVGEVVLLNDCRAWVWTEHLVEYVHHCGWSGPAADHSISNL